MKGTTVIPPGTPAAAALEQQLAHLAAAGGPVLDLRRLHWDAATSSTPYSAATATSRGAGGLPAGLPVQFGSASASTAGGWGRGWQAESSMRVQAALTALGTAAHAAAAAAAAEQAADGVGAAAAAGGGVGASEGDQPELLAALVEQVADLVPDVQLLVLPVLLPSGRYVLLLLLQYLRDICVECWKCFCRGSCSVVR